MTTDITGAEGPADGAPDAPLGEPGKKALQAERDARRQAEQQAAALQAQIDAINAEKLTDLEKAQQSAADAAARADEATREALRYRYAAKHGISDEDAALFLTGADEATISAQAERLAATLTAPKTPMPDLSQGGHGKPPAGSTAEQFAQFLTNKL